MKGTTKQTLEAFVEKASKIDRLKFAEHVKDTGFVFHMRSISQNRVEIEFDQADEKELNAALLTFRLFIQENEPISFPQLHKVLDDPGLSETFKAKLTQARQTYFKYLDGYPANIKPAFFEEGEHPSRNDILRVVLYGSMAHINNPSLRMKFKHWTREGVRENVLYHVFVRTVSNILLMINLVATLIREELSPTAG
jgi:hypothetical protein